MSELPESTMNALTRGPAGIHASESGMVMASGPEAVGLVRLLAIRSSLAFEIRTGVKMSRVSALKAANQALGTNYRRKKQAHDHLDQVIGVLQESP